MPIKFRKDRNKWQADCRAQGKGRPLFRTKREAEHFEQSCKTGSIQAPEKSISLEDCIAAYAKDCSENKVSSRNEPRYFNLMFHFLTGRRISHLAQVEVRDLQAFQQWLLKEQDLGEEKKPRWSKSTVNRAFHTYKHFYSTVVEWKMRNTNPCEDLKMLSEDEVTIQVIEPAAYDRAHGKAGWFGDTLEFINEVGCRPSSIERLKWADVDFKKREFTLTTKKGRDSQMKLTVHSMTDSIFSLLLRQRNQRPELGPKDSVFRGANGGPIRAGWISHKGGKLFGRKVVGGAMKALRHTLASDLTAAGIPTEIVRQALGHSNIRTTQRYARSVKTEVVAAAIQRVRGLSLAPNGTTAGETVARGAKEEIG